MSYDLASLILVEHFYPDWSFAAQEALAQLVQQLIEDYNDEKELLGTRAGR